MVLTYQPCLFIHENVLAFPVSFLESMLQPLYSLEHIELAPVLFGIPAARWRRYSICRLVRRLQKLGMIDMYWNELSFYFWYVMCCWFWIMIDNYVSFCIICVGVRMFKPVHEICNALTIEFSELSLRCTDYLLVTTVDILEKMKTLTSSQLRSLNSFKELASNSNIYDLSQNVAKRRRVANNIMFTLTKSCSSIWANREGRCFCV